LVFFKSEDTERGLGLACMMYDLALDKDSTVNRPTEFVLLPGRNIIEVETTEDHPSLPVVSQLPPPISIFVLMEGCSGNTLAHLAIWAKPPKRPRFQKYEYTLKTIELQSYMDIGAASFFSGVHRTLLLKMAPVEDGPNDRQKKKKGKEQKLFIGRYTNPEVSNTNIYAKWRPSSPFDNVVHDKNLKGKARSTVEPMLFKPWDRWDELSGLDPRLLSVRHLTAMAVDESSGKLAFADSKGQVAVVDLASGFDLWQRHAKFVFSAYAMIIDRMSPDGPVYNRGNCPPPKQQKTDVGVASPSVGSSFPNQPQVYTAPLSFDVSSYLRSEYAGSNAGDCDSVAVDFEGSVAGSTDNASISDGDFQTIKGTSHASERIQRWQFSVEEPDPMTQQESVSPPLTISELSSNDEESCTTPKVRPVSLSDSNGDTNAEGAFTLPPRLIRRSAGLMVQAIPAPTLEAAPDWISVVDQRSVSPKAEHLVVGPSKPHEDQLQVPIVLMHLCGPERLAAVKTEEQEKVDAEGGPQTTSHFSPFAGEQGKVPFEESLTMVTAAVHPDQQAVPSQFNNDSEMGPPPSSAAATDSEYGTAPSSPTDPSHRFFLSQPPTHSGTEDAGIWSPRLFLQAQMQEDHKVAEMLMDVDIADSAIDYEPLFLPPTNPLLQAMQTSQLMAFNFMNYIDMPSC
jgi:hypothetical protein